MPPHTKFDGGWFVFYRQSTGEYKRLAKKDEPRWQLLKAYDQFIGDGGSTFRECINSYLTSPQFKSLKPGTQEKYLNAMSTKGNTEKEGNREIMYSFGEMDPQEIGPPEIRLFMDS